MKRELLGIAAALCLSVWASAAEAHNCACNKTSCTVSCTESDLRDAVAVVNSCSGTTARTITVPTSCVMSMQMTSSVASCGNDNANKYNAICITASNITINGGASATSAGATFVYDGSYICASCAGECDGPQPALFLLKGSGNKLRNFTMKYFPEGLHMKVGANHVFDNVKNSFICEDAMTINNDASITGAQVIKSKLTGNSSAESGYECYERSPGAGTACSIASDCTTALPSFCSGGTCSCYCGDGTFGTAGTPCPANGISKCHRLSLCGLDKAIQINGGASTIGGSSSNANTINTIGQPVHVAGGTHTISFNSTDGNLNITGCHQAFPGYCSLTNNCDDVCQGYEAEGSTANATFTSNTISYCKFGIRGRNGATLTATSNILKDNYLSAFQVDGSPAGKIKGQTNKMKHNGCFDQSQSERAALVVLDNSSWCVDFGKGNFGGTACIGTSKSTGGNVFCNDNSGSDGLVDVWNIGAAVGAQSNSFDGAPELAGPGAANVNTSGASTNANCSF